MIFLKGLRRNVGDPKGNHDKFTTAFAEFIESADCPAVLKELLQQEKLKYDVKTKKKNMPTGNNVSQKIQSNYSSQISELDSQDSTMQDLHLGGSLLGDIAR